MNNKHQETKDALAKSSKSALLLCNQSNGLIILSKKLKGRTMDTITKVNQVSFHPSLGQKQVFTIKLASNKFDNFAGSELLLKIESWASANVMMNKQELPTLIIDMQNVDFIDSQGLNKLLASLRIMKSQGGNLLLCSLHNSVRLVFEITRIDQLFAILPSFEGCITADEIIDKAVLSHF